MIWVPSSSYTGGDIRRALLVPLFSNIVIHFNPHHISSYYHKICMYKGERFYNLRVDIQFVRACPRCLLTILVYLVNITFLRENNTGPLINCDQPKNFYWLDFISGTIHNIATNERRIKFNTCVTIYNPLTNIITCVRQAKLEKSRKKLAMAHCC